MSREQALAALKKCLTGDNEADHGNADQVLCELLVSLGYGDVVAAWDKIDKWYA